MASKRKAAITPSSNTHPSIPDPFTPAPPSLAPFLNTLSTTSVYITHIDRHPTAFKRQIFLVPLALNLLLTALLSWRAYAIAPHYWQIILHLLGHEDTGTSITPSQSTWGELFLFSVKRISTFGLDFVLAYVVAGWPLGFFLEQPHNPISWRWNIGFRASEIVVRVSRGWSAADLLEARAVEGKDASKGPFFKTRVLPAIEKGFVREKTGYLMMGKDWDLDFGAMVLAHKLVERGSVELECFEKAVWVWVPLAKARAGATVRDVGGQWCGWEVYRLDEGSEEEGRKKIVQFKDRLTAMGKESLFFRWIELIQYESSQPGGFTHERQVDSLRKVKKLFDEQGVDFDELARSIGGVDGMPGFEK